MHPEILSIALFWFVTAYTPGPNNVVASYSGFNFGITRTIPHILGVTLGFTSLVIFLTIGLINVFKLFPLIQIIIKYLGTLFLIFSFYSFYEISIVYLWIFVLLICVSTDIGGYVFGKLFKGPRLTKISPNKTYSGMIGGYLLSLIFSLINDAILCFFSLLFNFLFL